MTNTNSLLVIGDFNVDLTTGLIDTKGVQPNQAQPRLEPKSVAVLSFLVANKGQVVSKDAIINEVWPNSYATDESLARTLSRLRASLGDNARKPSYIETVPKRGYRLIAKVVPQAAPPVKPASHRNKWIGVMVLLVALSGVVLTLLKVDDLVKQNPTLTKADNFYHQMRFADNEMAITLYQQQIRVNPQSPYGYAGLANALVQRTFRWGKHGDLSITQQAAQGLLNTDTAQSQLQRALSMASKAVSAAPNDPKALKALGFVQTGLGQFDQAIATYNKALATNQQAWPVLLNLGELQHALGNQSAAKQRYEQAYKAMQQNYDSNVVQVRPWLADVAAILGDLALQNNQLAQADQWYREALNDQPLHQRATLGLVKLLVKQGDPNAGLLLCQGLAQRLTLAINCDTLVASQDSEPH